MAEVAVDVSNARDERASARARERFLTLPRALGLFVFVAFALSFDQGYVHDDGSIYYAFLRALFGKDPTAVAYQFGSAFWNAPFYLASQLVALRGHFGSFHTGEIATTVASNVAVLLTLYLGWRMLRELDLPRGSAVLLLTLFGTPLFYYGALSPSYKHAADALYATALFWFLLRATTEGARRLDFVVSGVLLGLLIATRLANIALWGAVIAVFLFFRLRRPLGWMVASALVTTLVLLALPVIRHIPYGSPPSQNIGAPSEYLPQAPASGVRLALGTPRFIKPVSRNTRLDVTVPAKMLFTLRRGLFLWTPLTFFATVGFILLVRRDRKHRQFLSALGLSALALLLIHSIWGVHNAWMDGGSFSQRFLTALFPFFLVGTAEFVRRTRRLGIALLSLCAAFSVFVGLIEFNGYYGQNSEDSLTTVIGALKSVTGPRVSRYHAPPPSDSLENFGFQLRDRVYDRWRLYWRIVT